MTEQCSKSRSQQLALAGLVLVGLAVVAAAATRELRARAWVGQLASADPVVRREALAGISRERETRASDALLALLQRESDREALELAGYAALRVHDRRAIEWMRRRTEAGPDDGTRARLILYAARLAERDPRLMDWLTAGASSSEPWRRVGSALGLLELGRPEGGRFLLGMIENLPPDAEGFAAGEFRRIAEPMTQAVGHPLDAWPDPDRPGASAAAWGRLGKFWAAYATPQLLGDVLSRLERLDPPWHEVNRLLHARIRVARWLQ